MLLYKYTRAKHLASIVQGNLAFPRHSQLNDPFESSIESAIDHLRIDYKYNLPQASRPLGVEIEPGLLRHPFNSYSENRDQYSHNLAVEDHNKRLEDAFKYLLLCRDRLGILSLTSDPENVVMWAHYAENSAGVCVGIELGHAFFKEYKPTLWEQASDFRLFQPKPVTYRRLRPTYGEATALGYVVKAFFTKYDPWSYEQEYRLLRPIDECDTSEAVPLYRIPNILIKEIILGMKAPDQVRQLALDLSKKFKHLMLTRIESVSAQYQLERRSLN